MESRSIRSTWGRWVRVLVAAAVVLGVMSVLSGKAIRSTALDVLGKSRLWIAYAQGAPVTTSWAQLTCRTVSFRYDGYPVGQTSGPTGTQTVTIPIGPASWQVEYRQNNNVIFSETWVAGDGTGPAADFDDSTGQAPRGQQFGPGGPVNPPGTVLYGIGSSCTPQVLTSVVCPGGSNFNICRQAQVFTLSGGGYYSASLVVSQHVQAFVGGGSQGSTLTDVYSFQSTPKGWTVTGGTP